MDKHFSRREMMGAGLASLGALALNAQPDKPVNLGLIGLGLRSKVHLGALKKLGPESRITALCDIQPDRMAKVNETLPVKAESYVDYRELVRDKNVGAVVIITPGYLHHEMVLAALRAGKDVLVEKPMAINYGEALDVILETRRSGRVVAVGMQRRYTRIDTEMRRVIESGAIGPIRFINYEEYRGDWNPQTWQYTNPATGKKTSWRFLKRTSGSSELEFSVHALAHVSSMVNSPLARLSGTGGVVHYTGRDTRDISALAVDFANGVRFSYSFSCFAAKAGSKCLVIGDKGILRQEGSKITLAAESGGPQPVKFDDDISDDGAEVQMYREFFRNVRERKPSPLRPEVALEPSKIAYAAEIAISENRIVTAKDFA